jgi:hypothetical protein
MGGDNVTRTSPFVPVTIQGQKIDEWLANPGLARCEITVSEIVPSSCFAQLFIINPDNPHLTLTIRQQDLPSGPHKLSVQSGDGVAPASLQLTCVGPGDDPVDAQLTYTFKWSS